MHMHVCVLWQLIGEKVAHAYASVCVVGSWLVVVVVAVVTFFNHNFVNCNATLILAITIKIYEIKYNIYLNDIHT